MSKLHKPVFLIGAHRSGTTWLGNVLGTMPEFAYWSEPRQVWSYKNWNKPDDRLTGADVTEQISTHISRRFEKFVAASGCRRFCEKTPSNCLRIPFINEIFPDGRFLMLARDGRAAFRSTVHLRRTGGTWSRIIKRISETELRELPAFKNQARWVIPKIIGRDLPNWGAHPPGWGSESETISLNESVASQWAMMVTSALDDLREIPDDRKLLVRYEDLLAEPAIHGERIAEFIQPDDPNSFINALRSTSDGRRADEWQNELSPETLDEINPILNSVLARLGYSDIP